MFSLRSIYYFVLTNSFLWTISSLEYFYQSSSPPVGGLFGLLLLRNLFLTWVLDRNTRHYPWIGGEERRGKGGGSYEFFWDIGKTTAIEALGIQMVSRCLLKGEVVEEDYLPWSLLRVAFLFEIFFDLFHYITHRALHHPTVYPYLHKYHHQHHRPTVYSTYHHHPMDLLLTNVLPMMASVWLIGKIPGIGGAMSMRVFRWLHLCKEYVEISGHSGRDIKKTGSFVQCVWIPRLLGISLYTADHDLHHRRGDCNYAKRFTLWDNVFGTYALDEEKEIPERE